MNIIVSNRQTKTFFTHDNTVSDSEKKATPFMGDAKI